MSVTYVVRRHNRSDDHLGSVSSQFARAPRPAAVSTNSSDTDEEAGDDEPHDLSSLQYGSVWEAMLLRLYAAQAPHARAIR